MVTNLVGLWLALVISLSLAKAPAAEETVLISAPLPGQVLQGAVAINGSTQITGFVSAELTFSYSQKPSPTWFLIQSFDQPAPAGNLATWDTSAITDGVYDLRLIVNLNDGTQKEFLVTGLRVRNYTPVETSTPTPTPVRPAATLAPTQTKTITPIPLTATPLPTNPAGLTAPELGFSLLQGTAVALGLFILGGIYLGLKAIFRR